MFRILPDKDMCCGCGGCFEICNKNAVQMKYDKEGFLYPEIDEHRCVECKLCIARCPILKCEEVVKQPRVYAAYNLDENIRLNSSSGGIFTALAKEMIETGGVVFGATFAGDKKTVHMTKVESESELWRLQGSKYVQCEVNGVFNEVKNTLNQGITVLFSGTPCQIGALKAFLGKQYNNLYTIDFICHGVPSPNVWSKYLSYLEKKENSSAQRIFFRHKKYGWKNFSVLIEFLNSTEYCKKHTEDIFFVGYNRNLFLRPSCYQCVFKGNKHLSDITLADFWGVEEVFPEMDDDKGVSMVILNNDKGAYLWNKITYIIKSKETSMENVRKYNRSYYLSAENNLDREKFLKKVDNYNVEALLHKYCDFTIFNRMRDKIRRLRGR